MTVETFDPVRGQALTDRELEIVRLVAEGLTNRQIGETIFLSPATVKTHLQRIALKVGIGDRSAIVAHCMREGLIS